MLAGVMSLILTLGIARFSYTPLLPIMQAQTGLGMPVAAGWRPLTISDICGAIVAASVSDLKIKDSLYRIGLVLAFGYHCRHGL